MRTETATWQDALLAPRSAPRSTPTLWWTDEAGPRQVRIEQRALLGAAESCDVRVRHPSVSRLHAELTPSDEGLWIRDLGSRNGTFVAGARIREACLRQDHRWHAGGCELELRYGDETHALELWPSTQLGPLVGRSEAMRRLFRLIVQVASSDATVLIQGETGTGKELVAQAIHELSPRSAGPYVVVDCGALPRELLEAELFGHARGAFTGAGRDREGAAEAAHGGVLVLDEVGELPLSMQPKLLRMIESKQVRRLGENRHRTVDLRVVAATHRDLHRMVNEGSFREDLFFRLAVLQLDVPPLRERREDVGLLARRFLGDDGAHLLDDEVLEELARRAWPGNVRELRNFVERLKVLGLECAREPSSATPAVEPARGTEAASAPRVATELGFKHAKERWVRHFERVYLESLLDEVGGNVTAAAERAGIDRSYVHRLLRKHEIDPERG